ncbi:MAG: SagB/ThcOx family dehydrogenase [Candidatus Lokiarchaeota archaeon]|nr:SagB/ThcOx family dehydrogenase [Candidatus Lokiarchaeota archaeon]
MEKYHKSTVYDRCKMNGSSPDILKPDLYKKYPNSDKVPLPKPKSTNPVLLDDALRKRRSFREYLQKSIDLDTLSYLLWATSGINKLIQSSWGEIGLRTAPSAGACYPIETYIIVNKLKNQIGVKGLDMGVYHYDVEYHQLEVVIPGDFREPLMKACLEQHYCGTAPVVFIFTAIFNRTKYKYEDRGYRYIFLDAGHQVQNLALAITGLHLGGVPIGAFYDDEMNSIIAVDGIFESTIYVYPIGCIK